jgi:hypothetical protein
MTRENVYGRIVSCKNAFKDVKQKKPCRSRFLCSVIERMNSSSTKNLSHNDAPYGGFTKQYRRTIMHVRDSSRQNKERNRAVPSSLYTIYKETPSITCANASDARLTKSWKRVADDMRKRNDIFIQTSIKAKNDSCDREIYTLESRSNY